VGEQVAIIYAATNGALDDVAVEDAMRFNAELRQRMQSNGLAAKIDAAGKLEDDVKAELDAAIADFRKDFGAGE
jgi:F-type H+-transporting ATPase subunit alpha